ncbi:MAG: DUF3800 domain-containing protein [Cyanobium sp. MAG06]|nr:DUF3800 domain-containing protein [Cyanobium sp. MAG06]
MSKINTESNINNESNNAQDKKLSDYKDIWTKFCFLDESGSLTNPTEKYFTIGIFKITEPYYIQNKIKYLRDKNNFYNEIKFNKASNKNIMFLKEIINELFNTRNIDFYSYTTHKDSVYFKNNFDKNEWQGYEDMSIKLLNYCIGDNNNEILTLIADYIQTPKDIKYEVNVRKRFNNIHNRLSITGVLRLDSKTNDLLQLTDLIIGIITYNLKLENKFVTGDKNKIELVKYFMEKLGVDSFIKGFKNHNFKIFVEKLNTELQNEKRSSS